MEPEDTGESAPDSAIPEPTPPPKRAAPRTRKPRAAAASASPTTAAPRASRGRSTAPRTPSGRNTASRSASTGGASRTRRTASVPPEKRTTAADALVDLPEPADPHEVETAEVEVAEAVTSDAPAEQAVESPAETPAAVAEEPDPESIPAPELTTEAQPGTQQAADDAFRDLVGSSDLRTDRDVALDLHGLTKRYGAVTAVDGIDLRVPVGAFFGIVGPNGAGKTTTLSMVTGMIRPDAGSVAIYGHDLVKDGESAKRVLGVLPDRLRLFDRLTGAQLLHYAGTLRGLDRPTIARRSRDLAVAFGLTPSLGRRVSDYSVGMTKKIAIAAALIHAPRMLVLDEPFESVDPVSAAAVLHVLRRFTESGGTVVLSSHSMELIESTCDALAIIVDGRILAAGPTADVLSGVTLEDRFVELAGGRSAVEGMEWLHSYAD